jgi:hypothetical protein
MRFRLPQTVAVLALALCACPTPVVTPPDDAGTLDLVGRRCNVDAECGPLRCDSVRRQCICLSDESCKSSDPAAAPKFCNNYTGLCVTEIAGCTKDADCKDTAGNPDPTQYCDPSIRACRPVKAFCEGCAGSYECGGAIDDCITDVNLGSRFCGRGCVSSTECPRGSTCQNVDAGSGNQCWPSPNPATPTQAASCKNFTGCTPDSLTTCLTDGGCDDANTQKCDSTRGKCVAIDQRCPFGTVCDPRNRICVAECSKDEDCGDPKLRCNNKVCEPVGECTTDAQCALNKVCTVGVGQTVGQCTPFCQTDLDCPIDNICQRQPDGRYKCQPGCKQNSNCNIDQRCNTSSNTCEGPQVGTVRTCQATVACQTCELCNLTTFQCFAAKATFPYCQPCSTPSECTGGTCVQMDDGKNYCAKFCGTGQECPQGFVCLQLGGGSTNSACVPSNRQCAGKCP